MNDVLHKPHAARWWHALEDGRIQCDLCPRECKLHDGQRAACFVRERVGNELVLSTWGRSSGFCVDPIEKKPLFHFYPGSSVLSFGTVGCNLACKFCQNWDISRSRDLDRLVDDAEPAMIASTAQRVGAMSLAFTYNDPVIFAEYAIDVAEACHAQNIRTVAVSAGYISPKPRRAFFTQMDAANIDLKAFSEDYYFRMTGAHLAPVLDTLAYIRHETACWLEITTLLIEGANDGEAEIRALSSWVATELGADVPLHFSAFHPDYKLTAHPPTPPATVLRARQIAMDQGLHHVYAADSPDSTAAQTVCSCCGTCLIARNTYAIAAYELGADGKCPQCETPLAGRLGGFTGSFGNRRIPILLAQH